MMKLSGSKRLKMLFALLPFMTVIFYILTSGSGTFATESYKPPSLDKSIVEMLDKPATGSANDYSAIENLKIAAGILYKSSYFEAYTEGEVVANVGFKYVQSVKNTRKKSGTAVFSEAVSISTFVSVAEQKYIDNGAYLLRPSSSVSASKVTYGNTVYSLTSDTYAYRYGTVPNELSKYIINDSTITDAKFIGKQNGLLVYEYTFAPDAATLYSRNEMKYMADSPVYPSFKSVSMRLTMSADWIVDKMTTFESYTITSFGFSNVPCNSELTETFKYINEPQPFPEKDIFESLVPGEGGDVEKPKSPVDYLAGAFGKYIAGAPLELNAKLDVLGMNIDATLKLDLSTFNVDALVGDLFVSYRGDNVYLKLNGLKGFIPVDKLGEIASLLPLGDLDLGGLIDDPDLLASLFANATMETKGDITSIHMPFTLMDIGFDVTIRVNEAGGEKNLDSISAVITLADRQIKAEVKPAVSPVFPDIDNTYRDLSSVLGIVKPLLNTVNAQSYDIRLIGALGQHQLSADMLINKTASGADASVTASILGGQLNVKFVDGSLYLEAGNLRLKAEPSDFDALMQFIKQLMPPVGLDQILALLPSDINTLLNVLQNVEVTSENSFVITLNIGGETILISAAHDGEFLTQIRIGGTISSQNVNLNIDFASFGGNAPITVENAEQYQSAKYLTQILPSIKNLLDAKTYSFTLSAIVSGAVQSSLQCGVVIARTDNGADAVVTFDVDGTTATLTIKDNVIYFKLNEVRLRFALKDAEKLIAELRPFLPAQSVSMIDSLLTGSGLNLASILNQIPKDLLGGLISSIESFTANENSVTLHIAIGGASLRLELNKSGSEITSITAAVNISGLDVAAALYVKSISNEVSQIAAPQGEFVDAMEFMNFVPELVNLLSAEGYDLTLETLLSENGSELPIALNMKINRLQSGIELKGSLSALGVDAELAYNGGVVYMKIGNVCVKLDTSNLSAILAEIEKIVSLPSPDLTINIGGILNMLHSLSINGDSIALTLNLNGELVTATLTKQAGMFTSLTLSDVTLGGIGLQNTRISLHTLGNNGSLAVDDAQAYSEVYDIVKLIEPVKSLLSYKTFDFSVNAVIVAPDNTNTVITGQVVISLTQNGFNADMIFNAFDQQIGLKLIDGVAYLKINNIKLKMAANDINALIDELAPYMPQYMTDLLREYLGGTANIAEVLKNLVGFQLPDFSKGIVAGLSQLSQSGLIGDVLSMIDYLTVNGEGLSVGISTSGLTLNLDVRAADGNLSSIGANVCVKGNSINLSAVFNRLSQDETYLVVADAEEYVDILDIATYIDPVVNTINQKNFDLSLNNFVIDSADSTIKVNGNIKISPTFTQVEGENLSSFIDLYLDLKISIFNKKAVSGQVSTLYHSFIVTLKDLGLNQNKNIYLLYSSQAPDSKGNVSYKKYKIDYFSILEILDGVRSVLNLESPFLDDIIGEHKLNASTGIFDTLNIGGLDSIKTTLTNLLDTAKNALDLLGRVKTGFDAYMNSTSIEEMIAQLKNIFQGVQMPDISVDTDLIKKIFTTSISFDKASGDFNVHFDNSILTPSANDFGHLTLSKTDTLLKGITLNNVNFGGTVIGGNLTLLCPETIVISEPADKDQTFNASPNADYNKTNLFNDFSSAKYLIEDVLNTANLREFEISGKANLKVPVIANLNIPLNVKVKILPNGKTVAAIKLEVPNNGGMLYTLRKSDSYIFFYEDRLYFMRDLYDCDFFITKHWYNGTTQLRSCTPQEFFNDPFPYIFFLLPLANSVTSMIPTDSQPDLSMAPPSLDSALNRYSYNQSTESGKDYFNYCLNLSLSKLTRNKSLGDLQLNLSTQKFKNAAGLDMRLLSKIYVNCEIVTAIPITLNSSLVNIDFNTGKSTGITPVTFGYKYPSETTAIDNLGIAINKIFG